MLPLPHTCASSLHAACPSVIPSHTHLCVLCHAHTLQVRKQNEHRHPDELTRHSFSPLSFFSLSLPSYSLLHFCTPTLLTHSVLLTFLRQIPHLVLSFSLSLNLLTLLLLNLSSVRNQPFCSSPLLHAPRRAVVRCIIRDESVVQLLGWW